MATAIAEVNGKGTRATMFCADCEIRSEPRDGQGETDKSRKENAQVTPFMCVGA